MKFELKGTEKPEVEIYRPADDSTRVKATLQRTGQLDRPKAASWACPVRSVERHRARSWRHLGQQALPGGTWTAWSAVRQAVRRNDKERDREDRTLDSLYRVPVGEVWFPL